MIYTLRAHVRGQRDQALELDTLGGAGDLLQGIYAILAKLDRAPKPHTNSSDQALDVLEVAPAGRRVWVRADAGPYGNHGTTTNVDTRARVPFGDRDANMIAKRAMFVIPRGAEVGLLFSERRAASHLKDHLDHAVLAECRRMFDVGITINAWVDRESWDKFLAEAVGLEAKSVWRPRTAEQRVTGALLEDEGEVRVVITGGAAERVVRAVRGQLRTKMRGQPDAFEIETPRSLLPADAENYERRSLQLKVAVEDEARTIVIERSEPPLFAYPLQGHPADRPLLETWIAETERAAQVYDLAVAPGWHSGAWTAEQLSIGDTEPR